MDRTMLGIVLLVLFQTGLIASSKVSLEAAMPNVSPKSPDLYLCHKVKLDESVPVYITEFEAKSTQEIAHHILLFACSDPGPEETWNCGEMSHKTDDSQFVQGPVCRSRQNIIFAWALDAPKLVLPEDVAFKLGGDTNNKYLVVQVHYANVDKFKDGSTDNSGIILNGQTEPVNKLAGVYLMATGGSIPSQQNENFEVACQMRENVEIHPFAYRTHAHKLAIVNSGYLVRNDKKSGKQTWTEIGRRSPQLPQMFFPVSNEVVIKRNDIMAARCTMYNFRDHEVRIGSTGEDEMCNFYIMYWVDGDHLLKESTCVSNGPPFWHFNKFVTYDGVKFDEDSMPENMSQVPQVQLEELERMNAAGGMHANHGGAGKQADHSKMDHSKMDHSKMKDMDMDMEDDEKPPTKSKNTVKIIEMLLEKYGAASGNRLRRLNTNGDAALERNFAELERAYLLKKLMNQLDLE